MSDWQPISTAPKDRIIWVYAPGVQELGPITCLCQWHEDGGFCVDELRWPTLWHTPKPPEPPLIEREMTGILAALTDEQRERAFAYDSPINHGDPAFKRPAVPIEKSVTEDYVICLEDGKKFKSLKRHLMMHYNLTPDEYREKWGLPADYPMVAPSYAEARKRLAASMGLGRSPRRKAS